MSKAYANALAYLIDEVSGFNRPALRDLIALDLNLFCENMISDLLA
jgi:hypothetical protein